MNKKVNRTTKKQVKNDTSKEDNAVMKIDNTQVEEIAVDTKENKNVGVRDIDYRNRYKTHIEPKLKEIEQWYREGRAEGWICKQLDIAMATYNNYKSRESHLIDTMKKGKDASDQEVVNSVFRRANGYQFIGEKVTTTKPDGTVIVKESIKDVPASDIAAIFWLTNRKPEDWKRNQPTELTGKDGKPISITFVGVDNKGKEVNK